MADSRIIENGVKHMATVLTPPKRSRKADKSDTEIQKKAQRNMSKRKVVLPGTSKGFHLHGKTDVDDEVQTVPAGRKSNQVKYGNNSFYGGYLHEKRTAKKRK